MERFLFQLTGARHVRWFTHPTCSRSLTAARTPDSSYSTTLHLQMVLPGHASPSNCGFPFALFANLQTVSSKPAPLPESPSGRFLAAQVALHVSLCALATASKWAGSQVNVNSPRVWGCVFLRAPALVALKGQLEENHHFW